MTKFYFSDEKEPHIGRTKEILKKHPEIKKLMGRNPNTIFYIIGIVLFQYGVAWFCSTQAWWVTIIAAYVVGAFCNHALFTLIHEAAHNLIFRKEKWNIIAGIIADLPNGFPTSAGFRKYHLLHHANQGKMDLDADLPSEWEAKLVGNTFIGKSLWLMFYPLIQITRTSRLKSIKLWDKYTITNSLVIIISDILLLVFLGPYALLYFVLSLFFSVGMHPLGARWIQEHYLVHEPQETYSYYGILNNVAFNVGYHNEHHDFMAVPWNSLPKIKDAAPEYYDSLESHKSWTKLWLKFLFDRKLSLFSRSIREK